MAKESAVRLLGPDMTYHQVDPYLPQRLKEMGVDRGEILSYISSTERMDICFEDSWTGYFIAERFRKSQSGIDLTIIHLDDHTDMMPTLLCVSGDRLTDPTSGAPFDPRCSGNWVSAIHSGAINIGNYMTALYYSGSHVHIRHLNNAPEQSQSCWILRDRRQYELIPAKQFASIAKLNSSGPDIVGSYCAASSPEEVLNRYRSDWTIIHIDLDYFINDFNGASRGADYRPDPALRTKAEGKLERFFDALAKSGIKADRWMIATSPGFCSAFHWEWLLSEIRRKIDGYERQPV
jgi:hypothetical protein